jgi:enoyl-CoA hydratase/carnithine racemase
MEMLLSGELIDAPTAQRFGLVDRVVPASSLDEEAARITRAIAGKSPLTLRTGEEASHRQLEASSDDTYGAPR